MLFVMQYNRRNGSLSIQEYSDTERDMAEDARITLEIKLSIDGINDEVVLLEADSLDALRKTHRRYFENATQLAESSATMSESEPKAK